MPTTATQHSNPETPAVSLPESLRQKFFDLERRLWRLETGVAVCRIAGSLSGSYLILFISDRLWNTPVWLRISIVCLGVGISVWAAFRWVQNWVLKRRDLRALSKLVQLRFRRLGDRLLGIVELTDEEHRPAYFSAELYRAAVEQVTIDASPYDFREAVSFKPVRVRIASAASIAILALAPLLIVPAAAWNAFRRWINPAASIDRYTLTALRDLPAQKIVAHGEPFEMSGTVEYRSFWHPIRAFARYADQPRTETAVQATSVRFQIPGQVNPGKLRLDVGDAKQEIAVTPTYRPSLKQLSASVQLPDYLQYPATNLNVQSGALSVVEGSRAVFRGTVNRKLTSAQLLQKGGALAPLNVAADTFSTGLLDLNSAHQLSFSWQDDLGLTNAAPWRLSAQTVKDLAPRPELPDLAREIAVLITEVVQLNVVAQDDFGVKELGLNWQLLAEQQATNTPSPVAFRLAATSPRQTRLEETFRFSPAVLRIPPDSTVEIRAYATDFYPNRGQAESPSYRIHVLGAANHAEMVRQKLENVLARLEEVTRLEENVSQSTRELAGESKEDLNSDKNSDKIAEAKENQAQNTANLEQLAKEGAEALREAARNPTLSEKTVRDWAQNIQQMQQLAQGEMQQASQELSAAEQNKQSRPESLAKAAEKQQEAMQALEQMQKQIGNNLDDLQAMTLAQRLRKASSKEQQIESGIQKNIQDTIGLNTKDLSPRQKKANDYLAADQTSTQKDTQELQREISRFFERTGQARYGEVNKQMTESKAAEELDKIRDLIQENIGMEASRNLNRWASKFTAWADILDPKNNKSSSGSGSGSGGGDGGDNSMADRLMEQLLSLLRLRQGEINLRDRTLLLDSQKGQDKAALQSAADALSEEQRQLLKRLVSIERNNVFEALQDTLKEIYVPMQDAETLLSKTQIGNPAISNETKAVDAISDIVNLVNEKMQKGDSSQQQQQQSAMAQQMAFLMQMMAQQQQQNKGMSVNQNPGRSTAGGTTDKASPNAEGDMRGKEADNRRVNKGSGVTGNVPTEFRDALQNYFDAIEQQNP